MIRVNLKKNASRGPSVGGTLSQVDLKDLKSLKSVMDFKRLSVSPKNLNGGSLILVALALALAALPHFFFQKYQTVLARDHQSHLSNLNSEIDSVKSEISKYETYKSEMKSFEEQESKINQRLSVVKQLQTSRMGPVNVLDAVGQALPQRVWLTAIEMTLGSSGQIQLTGRGYSSEDVAEFVDKLNNSIYFEKVVLDGVSTEKDGDQSGTVKSFLIFATPKLNGASTDRAAASEKGQ